MERPKETFIANPTNTEYSKFIDHLEQQNKELKEELHKLYLIVNKDVDVDIKIEYEN